MCVQLSSLLKSSLGVEGTAAYPSLACTAHTACSLSSLTTRGTGGLRLIAQLGCLLALCIWAAANATDCTVRRMVRRCVRCPEPKKCNSH